MISGSCNVSLKLSSVVVCCSHLGLGGHHDDDVGGGGGHLLQVVDPNVVKPYRLSLTRVAMPPSSRGGTLGLPLLRPREKSLVLLVLAAFAIVCFGAIFFLPDRPGGGDYAPGATGGGNKVYRVYQELRDAGQQFILPPPPLDERLLDNPNVRHGVLDRPNPHRVDDKARLLAQIEMDMQVNELSKKRQQQQQVLPKPNNLQESEKDGNLPRQVSFASSSSSTPKTAVKVARKKPVAMSSDFGKAVKTKNGQDPDPDARAKRDKVQAVSTFVKYSLYI